MHNILHDIVEKKKHDLTNKKNKELLVTLKKNKAKTKSNFKQAILHSKKSDTAVIAEIKLSSPTEPKLGMKSEMIKRAQEYETVGADAISFITEQYYFQGTVQDIIVLKQSITIPILQKDFVVDPYQIYEAESVGADALLLIARLVDNQTLQKFVRLCLELGIEPVVEINTEEDLEKAVATKTNIIAVNARNLEDFTVNVEQAGKLLKKISDNYIKLGFSGIHSFKEVKQYKDAGVKGVLIGTSLMKSNNISISFNSLLNI